jgi:signal transduction histidine kinase
MTESIEKIDSSFTIFNSVNKDEGIKVFVENNKKFLEAYNKALDRINEPGEEQLVENIYKYYVSYVELFLKLQNTTNIIESEKYVLKHSQIDPEFFKLEQELKSLYSINERGMFNSKENALNSAQKYMYLSTVLLLISILGGLFVSKYFVNLFLKPIHSLTQTIRLVKEGNLEQQTNIHSNDEIGELANEFNNMTIRLRQYEKSTLGKLVYEKNKSVAIVRNISEPLIVLDNSYRIVLLNNSSLELFEIDEENSLNKHFLEVIKNGEVFEFISDNFESNQEYKDKIFCLKLKQETYYFKIVVSVFKDGENDIMGLIVLFYNITKLKKSEELRTDFLATVSHEFKTPLTSIMMITSLLFDENVGQLNEEQTKYVNVLKDEGEKLSELTENLLNVIKIESNKDIFTFASCSIIDIIKQSIDNFSFVAQKRNIKLYYNTKGRLFNVTVDFEKIIWVLNNLISNALKYTSEDDEIRISARVEQYKMLVSIEDSGEGIPDEFKNKIFEKFVQVKGEDLEARGSGFGLFAVKEIIEAHQGQIWCESEMGSGSKFTFTLPLDFSDISL